MGYAKWALQVASLFSFGKKKGAGVVTGSRGIRWSSKVAENEGMDFSESAKKIRKKNVGIFFFRSQFFCSSLFFFSKKKWREFDERYLAYWYHARRIYASKSYKDVIKDKKGFRNPISFHTEKYLNRLGLDHSGKIIGQS